MKNLTQTVSFKAFAIIPPSESVDLYKKNPSAVIDDKTRKQLDHIGAETVNSDIGVSLTVGSFLFDLYATHTPKPEAPLLIHLFNKKMSEFAEILNKDEFDVPGEILECAKKVLADSELWKKTVVATYVSVGEEKRTIAMTSQGISYFGQILNQVIEACL